MDPDSPMPFREKIRRLGVELDSLHDAIKEEIEMHERWSPVTDGPDDPTGQPEG